MRSLVTSRLLALVLGAFLLSSCGEDTGESEAGEVRDEARELADSLASYGAERRDEAVERAEEALADLDGRIERLEEQIRERWSGMDQRAREEAEDKLELLEAQRGRALDWYRKLEDSSAEAWGRVREGFADAYSALTDAWEEARQELDEER